MSYIDRLLYYKSPKKIEAKFQRVEWLILHRNQNPMQLSANFLIRLRMSDSEIKIDISPG